jgi:hypothetical protein
MSSGLAFSLPVKLKGENILKTTFSNATEEDYFNYPALLALGTTWKLYDYVYLSSDIDYQFWGDTELFDNAVNSMKMGVGVNWIGISRSNNLIAKIPVRAGISYRNLPFKYADNLIYETGYHFGVSVPLKQFESYLDVGVKLFTRGDAAKHGYEESGFLITIGTQGFDFLRRPLNRKAPREIPRADN